MSSGEMNKPEDPSFTPKNDLLLLLHTSKHSQANVCEPTHPRQPGECLEPDGSSVFYYSTELLSDPTNRKTPGVRWDAAALKPNNPTEAAERERERCNAALGSRLPLHLTSPYRDMSGFYYV